MKNYFYLISLIIFLSSQSACTKRNKSLMFRNQNERKHQQNHKNLDDNICYAGSINRANFCYKNSSIRPFKASLRKPSDNLIKAKTNKKERNNEYRMPSSYISNRGHKIIFYNNKNNELVAKVLEMRPNGEIKQHFDVGLRFENNDWSIEKFLALTKNQQANHLFFFPNEVNPKNSVVYIGERLKGGGCCTCLGIGCCCWTLIGCGGGCYFCSYFKFLEEQKEQEREQGRRGLDVGKIGKYYCKFYGYCFFCPIHICCILCCSFCKSIDPSFSFCSCYDLAQCCDCIPSYSCPRDSCECSLNLFSCENTKIICCGRVIKEKKRKKKN